MNEGAGTMTTYQITGVPGLAVRLGQALERWGAQAAQPMSRDELADRHRQQRVHDAAVETRRSHLGGMYHLLK